MDKHTPGPWRVNGTRIRDCQPGIDCIATMQVSNQANWEDDARLIAAAPEILEALRGAEVLFSCHCRDSTALNWLDRARAAIAKATGNTA